MDPRDYSQRRGGLLHELLSALEDDDAQFADIFITPPQDGEETDQDSDNSDDDHDGNVNHLGSAMLKADTEVILYHNTQPDAQSIIEDDPSSLPFASKPSTSSSRPQARAQTCDSSDDDLPLSSFLESRQTSKKRKQPKQDSVSEKRSGAGPRVKKSIENKDKLRLWGSAEPSFVLNTNCLVENPPAELLNKKSPVDFFSLFFDENVMTSIVQQTNVYALAKNPNAPLNLTQEELYVIFGGLLLSGYGKYTNKRMYWAREDDVPKILSESMRLNRFESILRNLHLNDNSGIDKEDRLYKLRPLISSLNTNFRKFGGLEEKLSIDESMIPYYGKHYAKQYIKGEPIRFGFKNWTLCTDNGYLLAFEIYTGKSKHTDKFDFGLGGHIVLSLLDLANIPPNEGYKVFFDNYFTSVSLLSHLADKGYCASGTLRDNRLENCRLKGVNDDINWKTKNRGHFEYRSSEKVAIVKWKDNKIVCAGTNFDTIEIRNVLRYSRDEKSRITFPQPQIIIISGYNKGMGGVDKLDGMVANYRSRIRQRKWWWPIFAYLFDVSVVNAWLLMRKYHPNEPVCKSLLIFRRNMGLIFLNTYGVKSTRGKLPPKSVHQVRYDERNHIVDFCPSDRRCATCGKNEFHLY